MANVKKIHVGFNIYVQTNMCIQYAYKTIQNMFKKIRHGTLYVIQKKKRRQIQNEEKKDNVDLAGTGRAIYIYIIYRYKNIQSKDTNETL